MGNNHKSELEAVTALLVKYRDERNAYYAKTQKEIERLERELASEVSRHVETDKSYKHWRDKTNHLTAERDALKAQAEKLAGALGTIDRLFWNPHAMKDVAREALAAWREFKA